MTRLLEIMSQLRDPQTGCPWDKEQTLHSIIPCTIEEVYEVAEAIESGSAQDLCEELGDLLFQIVFYARISAEAGNFDFNDVIDNAVEKLTRRHPHVFGDRQAITTEQQQRAWEQHKIRERQDKARNTAQVESVMDGITRGLPAFIRALKLQKHAASVGFDWPDLHPVLSKVAEELAEVQDALAGGDETQVLHEIGDLLLAVTNLARHVAVDPERALQKANNRFEDRFRRIEAHFSKQGRKLGDTTLEEMEMMWQQVKSEEKKTV